MTSNSTITMPVAGVTDTTGLIPVPHLASRGALTIQGSSERLDIDVASTFDQTFRAAHQQTPRYPESSASSRRSGGQGALTLGRSHPRSPNPSLILQTRMDVL